MQTPRSSPSGQPQRRWCGTSPFIPWAAEGQRRGKCQVKRLQVSDVAASSIPPGKEAGDLNGANDGQVALRVQTMCVDHRAQGGRFWGFRGAQLGRGPGSLPGPSSAQPTPICLEGGPPSTTESDMRPCCSARQDLFEHRDSLSAPTRKGPVARGHRPAFHPEQPG